MGTYIRGRETRARGPEGLSIDRGTPGLSARQEAARLRAAHRVERRARLRSWQGPLIRPVAIIVAAFALGLALDIRNGWPEQGSYTAALLLLGLIAAALMAWRRGLFAHLRDPEQVRAWERQSSAEREVAAHLERLEARGWTALHDRQLPDWGAGANLDHVLVGPSGCVGIITASNAAEFIDEPMARAAEEALAHSGTSSAVVGVSLRGADGSGWQTPGGLRVLSPEGLSRWLAALPPVLGAEEVDEHVARVARVLPASGAGPVSFAGATSGGSAGVPASPAPPDGAAPAELAPLRKPPPAEPTPEVDLSDPERVNKILADLEGLPGLELVAEQVRVMAKRVMVDARRREAGLATSPMEIHALFVGPPGTAKTTVARTWGKVLAALGRLPRGHVLEVGRGDLVAGYVGQTAERTAKKLDEARGGVLFIDEAYALARDSGSEHGFGSEAIEAILTRMENEREKLCVIAAGYEEEMERFLDSNPGLRSRFARRVEFQPFSAGDLVRIAQGLARKADYRLDDEALRLLGKRLEALVAAPPEGWANARSVRRILDHAIEAQAARVASVERLDREVLAGLIADDIEAAIQRAFPHGAQMA